MCVDISAQRVSYSGTSARAPSVDAPLISFHIVSSAFKLLLHPDSVSSLVWSRYGVLFLELNIKHQVTGETSGLSAPIDLYRGVGGHATREKVWRI